MWSCLALRINSNVSFHNFLNLHHKSGLFALFAFLCNLLRLRICLVMSDVIHVGSVGFTLISLLGMHCLAISIRCSVTFSVYLLISPFLKLSQSVFMLSPSINHSCLVHKSQPSFGLKSFGHHTGKIELLRSFWGHFPSYYIDSNINFCINSGQYNTTRIKGERKFKKMCQIQNMKVTVSNYSFILHWFHLL